MDMGPNPDLVIAQQIEFGQKNTVLDALRRTRKQRGGTGAPLEVPVHLRGAAEGKGILITDADLAGVEERLRSAYSD